MAWDCKTEERVVGMRRFFRVSLCVLLWLAVFYGACFIPKGREFLTWLCDFTKGFGGFAGVAAVIGALGLKIVSGVKENICLKKEEGMDDAIWVKIVNDLTNNPRDLQTVPLIGDGHWFYAEIQDDCVCVSNAHDENHLLASSISGQRLISRDEFNSLYPLHLRRNKGEKVSRQATQLTQNQVYIYSVLRNCGGVK
jgi:hypothetical protein